MPEKPSESKTYSTILDQTSTGKGLSGFGDGSRGRRRSLPENLAYGLGERRIVGEALMGQNKVGIQSGAQFYDPVAQEKRHISSSLTSSNYRSKNITHFIQKFVVIAFLFLLFVSSRCRSRTEAILQSTHKVRAGRSRRIGIRLTRLRSSIHC